MLAGVDHVLGRLGGILLEDREDQDGISFYPIHDPPCNVVIEYPQFMAPRSDGRHGSGVRQGEFLTALEPSEQQTRPEPPA